MPLDIGAALRDGIERTVARSGFVLMVVLFAVHLSTAVARDTITRVNLAFLDAYEIEIPSVYRDLLPTPDQLPLALDVGFTGAIALALVIAVLAEAVRIVGVRVLVSDHTETIPREYIERNIGYATVNGFVGGIVVAILVAVGLVLFVVPGIFLAIAFFFVRQVIAVEDANFLEAMEESWHLTAGDRFELLALAVVVVAVGFVAALIGGIVGPSLIAARFIDSAIGAATTVFGMAVAARAYVQLREAEEGEDLTQWEELES